MYPPYLISVRMVPVTYWIGGTSIGPRVWNWSMGSLNVVLDEPVYEGFGVDSYITFQLFSLSPSNRRKGHSLRFKGPV